MFRALLPFVVVLFLPTLLRALWPPHDTRLEHSYTRYGDIMVYESDWYSGKRTNLVVVEVENELDEFKGTISDLLRNQGRYKIGVFYQEDRDFESRAAEIREIFGHFAGCGFREAADTRYLIVFGPTAISEAGGIGAWCALSFEAHLQDFLALRHPRE